MAVEHVNIADPNIHEPKGVATAAVDTVYYANGAGSGSWKLVFPHGSTTFVNLSTPYTLTYPATYTKLAPTTVASGTSEEFTEATTARLTYTGTPSRHARIVCDISFDQVVGANRDIEFAVYKNGSVISSSSVVCTTVSGAKVISTLFADSTAVTNDYFEIYCKNAGASGDVRVYSFNLSAHGFI